MAELRVFGPPGTGKTTFLTKQIRAAAKQFGSDNVLVASFTKAAAAELVGRDLPLDRDMVGTLHAHCYRQLQHPELANKKEHIVEWNATHPGYTLSVQNLNIDDPLEEGATAGEADVLFNAYNVYRARMIDRSFWHGRVLHFANLWETWKRAQGVMDFTDLIDYCYQGVSAPPGRPDVIFLDEVQDFTKLELSLARKWGENVRNIVLAGDDDQCQPQGSMVLTPDGYVAIEDLDPQNHRVVSYDRPGASVIGLRDGYAFQKSQRWFKGNLFGFTVGKKYVQATPEHKWIAKWTDTARLPEINVVYLMRKGDRYRIGWCQLFRSDNVFHLGMRARLEEADAAWIIKVCFGKQDASMWESILATQYGIPTIMFNQTQDSYLYTQSLINQVFSTLRFRGVNLQERAEKCLGDFHLDINLPIWTQQKAYERRGGTSIMTIESCNIIPELMEIPVHQSGKVASWTVVDKRDMKWYDGLVYSLDVEKYHLYISDGVVTHNCIYSFKGATPDSFLNPAIPSERVRILEQSYRVPRIIQAYSQQWINNVSERQQKEYHPRDFEGEIMKQRHGTWRNPDSIIEAAQRDIDNGKTVMFLTTCSYMLGPIQAKLREYGVPFHNPLRRSRGDWNPLHPSKGVATSERLLSFLRLDDKAWGEQARMWTIGDVKKWSDMLKADGVFQRGGKSKILTLGGESEEVPTSLLADLLTDEAFSAIFDCNIEWLFAHALDSYKKALTFPIAVGKHSGWNALREQPKLIIGTIHSVKGGEADVVYVFPDLSLPAWSDEWDNPGHRDVIYRQFYVGFTRAREKLVLCNADSMRAVPF